MEASYLAPSRASGSDCLTIRSGRAQGYRWKDNHAVHNRKRWRGTQASLVFVPCAVVYPCSGQFQFRRWGQGQPWPLSLCLAIAGSTCSLSIGRLAPSRFSPPLGSTGSDSIIAWPTHRSQASSLRVGLSRNRIERYHIDFGFRLRTAGSSAELIFAPKTLEEEEHETRATRTPCCR